MLFEIGKALQPLLNSKQGVHLTIYVNASSKQSLENQIYDGVAEARKYLEPIMTEEEQRVFLRPLLGMLEDKDLFNYLDGNLGIFLCNNVMRTIRIPVYVEPTVVVATSFHIKPLLKWNQQDREFIMIGKDGDDIAFYLGSFTGLHKVDLYQFAHQIAYEWEDGDAIYVPQRLSTEQQLKIVRTQIAAIEKQKKRTIPIYLVGDLRFKSILDRHIQATGRKIIHWDTKFHNHEKERYCSAIRRVLSIQVETEIESKIERFEHLKQFRKTEHRIDKIALFASRGEVRQLFVAEELMLFGKIEKDSGRIKIHHRHLNHEDDDVLDDLAQIVLSYGGEVLVIPRDKIPDDGVAAAVLNKPRDHRETVIRFHPNNSPYLAV